MDKQTYIITFDTISVAEANRHAEELRQVLLDVSPDVEVLRRRDNSQMLDFGSTLVLLVGTPAITAVVTALGNWLLLRNRASLTIKRSDEQIVLQNITSAQATKLAQLMLNEQQE